MLLVLRSVKHDAPCPQPCHWQLLCFDTGFGCLWTNICISSANACAVFCRVVMWTQALLLARQRLFPSSIATFSIRPVLLTIQQCGSHCFNLCFSDLDVLTLAKPCCLFLSHNQGVSVRQSAISNHLMGFNFLSLGFVIICLVLCYKSFARIS